MADRLPSGHPPASERLRPDIVSTHFFDNDTFYECRLCGAAWRGKAQPGVIHEYVLCPVCAQRLADAV